MIIINSNKMYEPWGYQEETNYESLQKMEMENGTATDAKLKELEDALKAEIARSMGEDTKHDNKDVALEDKISGNTSAIEAEKTKNEEQDTEISKKADAATVEAELANKADLEHEHEIKDITPNDGESPFIYLNANAAE